MYGRVIFTVCLLFIFQNNAAQTKIINLDRSSSIPANKSHFHVEKKPGHSYTVITAKDSIKVLDIDMAEMLDIIVEFKDMPFFLQQKENALKKTDLSSYRTAQIQFANDISRIYADVSSYYKPARINPPQKKREFYKLFNGTSLSIPRAMMQFVRSLGYVKKVQIDKKFKANDEIGLSKSYGQEAREALWNSYGNQGDSIVIGILDTGIDYLHPALGGGIGSKFKVIGGYDFVNNDNDPMDDNGHGTHVAGIVSADGDSVKGIVPKSLIMAFKVLDDQGFGFESGVIAGVERAADPNDDDNFEDMVNIANVSLGSAFGSYNDAVCTAVNNASRLGVLFCIAAGNDGAYYTIGSPGAAASAITVGAIDNNNRLAGFSSMGPVRRNYFVKPELLAPGVSILSTYPGRRYQSLSGTSMSTPYVTGICALIKKLHRNWPPEYIKSALLSAARDLGMNIMAQGAGKAEAERSSGVRSLTVPSLLSFGIDYADAEFWTKKETLKIINASQITQSYNVITTGLQQGINISVNPSDFTLHAGEEKDLTVSLSVDNKLVPYSAKVPGAYSGAIIVKGTADEMNIPWAFIKTPVLILKLDEFYSTYIIYNNESFYSNWDGWNLDDPFSIELPVASGRYNMFFSFDGSSIGEGRKFVFKENVDVNGFKEVSAESGEAVNRIEFNGVDENGTVLNESIMDNDLLFVLNEHPDMLITCSFLTQGSLKYYSSGFSENIRMFSGQYQNNVPAENKITVIQFPEQKGLAADIILKNNPADFIKQNIRISDGSDNPDSRTAFLNSVRFNKGFFAISSSSNWISDKQWEGTLYMSPDPDNDFGNSVFILTNINSLESSWFGTSLFRTRADSIGWFGSSINPGAFFMPDNGTMAFGDGAVYPFLSVNIEAGASDYKLDIAPRFFGQIKEERFSDIGNSAYAIYNSDNGLIKQDYLSNPLSLSLPKGIYRYHITNSNYTVGGIRGNAALTSVFDISHPGIPTLTSLRILSSKGIPVCKLARGENGKISFSAASSGLDFSAVKLFLKSHNSLEWQELKTEKIFYDPLAGYSFSSEMGSMTDRDSSAVDLRINIGDQNGNTTEWVLQPAFIIGEHQYTDAEKQSSPFPQAYAMDNIYPNPFNPLTTISYSLPEKSHVMLRIFDMLGREVYTLVDKEQKAGSYKVQLDAGSLSSGVYICSLRAGQFQKNRKIVLLR